MSLHMCGAGHSMASTPAQGAHNDPQHLPIMVMRRHPVVKRFVTQKSFRRGQIADSLVDSTVLHTLTPRSEGAMIMGMYTIGCGCSTAGDNMPGWAR